MAADGAEPAERAPDRIGCETHPRHRYVKVLNVAALAGRSATCMMHRTVTALPL